MLSPITPILDWKKYTVGFLEKIKVLDPEGPPFSGRIMFTVQDGVVKAMEVSETVK